MVVKDFKRGLTQVQHINRKKYLYVDGKIQFVEDEKINETYHPEVVFLNDIDNYQLKKAKVLSVGLGAGYTLKYLLNREYIEKIDTVEIYAGVIRLLNKFSTYEFIMNDKRSNIINKDIVKYVRNYDGELYDVGILDVCHPELICSREIFTDSFFNNLSCVIKKDGFVLMWFYSGGYVITNNETTKKTLNMLRNVFNNVNLYKVNNLDVCYFHASNNKIITQNQIVRI